MRRARTAVMLISWILALGVLVPGGEPASAQEAGLGGGSDIRAGTLVTLPAGTTIGPIHHVFADNPENAPIAVVFVANAPPGIQVTPQQSRFTIDPGQSVKDFFAIAIDETAAPGDHKIAVQLVRDDIESQPGQITNIPAVGTEFTIRVGGEAVSVTVEAKSAESGRPVTGTITLAAVTGPADRFEMARTQGSELTARVAPGEYEAKYLLEGRELASQRVRAVDPTTRVTLTVRTLSFVLVGANPEREGGKVVLAQLVASIENHLEPIQGGATVRARVYRDDQEIDIAVLTQRESLPLGVSEAKLPYRPPGGFSDGTYRFQFEVATSTFTVKSVDQPSFSASSSSLPIVPIAMSATALAAAAALTIVFVRRRRAQS